MGELLTKFMVLPLTFDQSGLNLKHEMDLCFLETLSESKLISCQKQFFKPLKSLDIRNCSNFSVHELRVSKEG